MVAGELPRNHHQLVVVEGHVTGLATLGVDARPDDMTVLARDAILVLLYMEDDRARLAGQPEAVLGAVDIIEILLLGEPPLPLVGIDRQAVKIVAAPRQRVGLPPFSEGAVQFAGYGSACATSIRSLSCVLRRCVAGPVRGRAGCELGGARSISFMSGADHRQFVAVSRASAARCYHRRS
jgi:hypothetical protein